MQSYLLIQSRDPFDAAGVDGDLALAADLAARGDAVTVLFVQNGVLPLRRAATAPGLDAVQGTRVEMVADDFALRERGIDPAELRDGVSVATIDLVVERLAAGHKTLWL